MPELTVGDFADLFDISSDSFDPECFDLIGSKDFSYLPIFGEERDHLILRILRDLETCEFSGMGQTKWEEGWAENLALFRESRDLADLIPRYIRAGAPLRFQQDYILPARSQFESDFFEVMRLWVFKEYAAASKIYEFGCGSGYNLSALSSLYPSAEVVGLDWASSSVEIAQLLSEDYPNISGRKFDLLKPDRHLDVEEDSCVITIGCFEQLGASYLPMLNFLINHKSLCVHLEPIEEFYDQSCLVDYLGYKFHQRRGYLKGYWTMLEKLRDEGQIEILKAHRVKFGSLFHDGWSLIVWRAI